MTPQFHRAPQVRSLMSCSIPFELIYHRRRGLQRNAAVDAVVAQETDWFAWVSTLIGFKGAPDLCPSRYPQLAFVHGFPGRLPWIRARHWCDYVRGSLACNCVFWTGRGNASGVRCTIALGNLRVLSVRLGFQGTGEPIYDEKSYQSRQGLDG
jgi:hypothetical protein